MRLDAIKIGKNPPDDVNVVIEVPLGGEPIKYEMDKESGALVVDRSAQIDLVRREELQPVLLGVGEIDAVQLEVHERAADDPPREEARRTRAAEHDRRHECGEAVRTEQGHGVRHGVDVVAQAHGGRVDGPQHTHGELGVDAHGTHDLEVVGQLLREDPHELQVLRLARGHRAAGAGLLTAHERRLDELAEEFDLLMTQDAVLPAAQRAGVSLVLAQRPWSLSLFAGFRRTPDGESAGRKAPARR